MCFEVSFMIKSLLTFITTAILGMVCACALAFDPGERTMHLLGNTLNSHKHPVHIVVEKTIDMKNIYPKETYDALPEARKKSINRIIFDEANGIYAERSITLDGDRNVLFDSTYFCKDGLWYYIDFIDKTYDTIPEVYGASRSFRETMTGWFNMPPVMGNDPDTGLDYDLLTKESGGTYYYFFEKDTGIWKGYGPNVNDMLKVVEVSDVVDVEKAFATPTEEYVRVPNKQMRSFSNNSVFMKK